MAASDPVSRIAGYRTRVHDRIVFDQATPDGTPGGDERVEVIKPELLVRAGEVDLATEGNRAHAAGEWGRIGPARSRPESLRLEDTAAAVPLSAEDAASRMTATSAPDTPTSTSQR